MFQTCSIAKLNWQNPLDTLEALKHVLNSLWASRLPLSFKKLHDFGLMFATFLSCKSWRLSRQCDWIFVGLLACKLIAYHCHWHSFFGCVRVDAMDWSNVLNIASRMRKRKLAGALMSFIICLALHTWSEAKYSYKVFHAWQWSLLDNVGDSYVVVINMTLCLLLFL